MPVMRQISRQKEVYGNEKNLSAQKESTAQGARFQSENEDHGGAQSAQTSSRQGQKESYAQASRQRLMLAKAFRLRLRGSFAYVRAHGTKFNERALSFVVLRGRGKRIGFIVSNKTGKAVRRNLAKRRMRAAAGELLGRIEGGQMIFIARRGIDELSYAEIKSQMTSLLEKSGMLKANGGAT